MSLAPPQQEVCFLQTVHELLEAQRMAEKSELRRTGRKPYPCLQMIAPYVAGKLPEQSQFHEVRCFDISTSGFSYLSPTPPEHGGLVVALGTPPKFTYLSAQVVHETPLTLVGCRFTGRVD